MQQLPLQWLMQERKGWTARHTEGCARNTINRLLTGCPSRRVVLLFYPIRQRARGWLENGEILDSRLGGGRKGLVREKWFWNPSKACGEASPGPGSKGW